MLTGKRFRLSRPTLGIQLVDGRNSVVELPANAVITVLSGPNANGRVYEKGIVYTIWEERTVIWEERTVALFAVDVEVRGIEITDRSAKA